MKAEVKIKGIPELQREMQRLSTSVQTRLGRNATMAAARVIAREARARHETEARAFQRRVNSGGGRRAAYSLFSAGNLPLPEAIDSLAAFPTALT